MKKPQKTQKPMGFFNEGFFEKTHWVQSDRTQSGPPCDRRYLLEGGSLSDVAIISLFYLISRIYCIICQIRCIMSKL